MSLIDVPFLKGESEEVEYDPRADSDDFSLAGAERNENQPRESETNSHDGEVEPEGDNQDEPVDREGQIQDEPAEPEAATTDENEPLKTDKEKKRKNKVQREKKVKKDGYANIPFETELKTTRACLICSLIKTETEFEEDGCDNCEEFLKLAGQRGASVEYTSANFQGMIGMINPVDSWVAKWQRLRYTKPGVYAVKVFGEVQPWIKEAASDAGRRA